MMAHELPMKAESSSTGPTLQAGELVQLIQIQIRHDSAPRMGVFAPAEARK
jgi:hypothetical protein